MTLTRTQLIAAGAVVVGLTQIGNGLKAVSYLVGVPEVAYAAKAKAEEVDDRFQQYLQKQQAYTEALNQVIQQQQQQAPNQATQMRSSPQRYTGELPPGFEDGDGASHSVEPQPLSNWWWTQTEQGEWYCQSETGKSWWPDAAGRCE